MTITAKIQKEKKPGDILLSFDKKCFLAKKIKTVTDSDFSHAFLYIGKDLILESGPSGVVIRPLKDYLDYDRYFLSLRRPNLSDSEQDLFISYCMDQLGVKYSYRQIIWLWFCYTFRLSRKPFFHRDLPGIICSELIAMGLKSVGWYPFSTIPSHVTPACISAHVRTIV